MILNIVSLVAALLALALSSWITLRQSRFMRHANEVPLLMETFKEYRSPQYQQYEHYVVNRLGQENAPELGLAKLPDEARVAATSLVTFFNIVGSFLIFDMTDESVVVPLFGYRANRAWSALEPFIVHERKLRGEDVYAAYFEDLICRVRERGPLLSSYGIRLRRLPLTPPAAS